MILVVVSHVGAGIAALSASLSCVSNAGFFVRYTTALLASFVLTVVSSLLMLFLLRSCSLKYNNCCRHLFYCVFIASGWAQIAWFLVKSQLYFAEVTPSCPHNASIKIFGAYLFVVELLAILFSLTVALARLANSTQQTFRADES